MFRSRTLFFLWAVCAVVALSWFSASCGSDVYKIPLHEELCSQSKPCANPGYFCVNHICVYAGSSPPTPPPDRQVGSEPGPWEPPRPDVLLPDPPGPPVDRAPPAICQPGQQKPCYQGPQGTAGVGRCRAGYLQCVNGQWDSVCINELRPIKEICGNGFDDDCDGQSDEQDECGDCTPGDSRECGSVLQGECKPGTQLCEASRLWGSCQGAITPTEEICDKKDNDCDGQVDEGIAVGAVCDTQMTGECREGFSYCEDGLLKCKPKASVNPEVCDGKDNDCNGQVDEKDPRIGQKCPTGKPGICGEGKFGACNGGQLSCVEVNVPIKEDCTNGRDDDCDGQTDGRDTDCVDTQTPGVICKACSSSSECGSNKGKANRCDKYPLISTSTRYCWWACSQDSDCPGGFKCRLQYTIGGQKYCGPPSSSSFYGMWYCDNYNNMGKPCHQHGDCGFRRSQSYNGSTYSRGGYCHNRKCTVHCQSSCPKGLSCRNIRNNRWGACY